MAERLSGKTFSTAPSFRAGLRIIPWWLRAILVYLLSRVVTTIIFVIYSRTEPGVNGVTGNMGYLEYANVWDAKWFFWIAYNGYPAELPVDANGDIAQNAWAFLPLFPMITRAFAATTNIHWYFWAILVSVFAGMISALLIDRLFVKQLGALGATFTVLVFSSMPLAPLFQVGYAESLGLMLLLLVIYLLINRAKSNNYVFLYPAVLLASLARPLGVAIALMLLIMWMQLLWKKRVHSFLDRDFWRISFIGLFAACSSLLWPVIAAVVTGNFNAYTLTELSWRKAYVDADSFLPFEGWWQGMDWWFGPGLGAMVLILTLIAFIVLVKLVKRFGNEITAWTISYPIYLFAVFFPQSSVWRLLFPLFSWVALPALIRNRLGKIAIIFLCILGQWLWLNYCWHVGANTWIVP